MMFFGGLSMIFGLLILLGVLALGVWLLIKAFSGGGTQRAGSLLSSTMGSHESALDILKKRYARGEINQAEYEEMRRQLEH